eukprot:scaffold2215_cov162-Amphora_coffeaeformis.AAC.11
MEDEAARGNHQTETGIQWDGLWEYVLGERKMTHQGSIIEDTEDETIVFFKEEKRGSLPKYIKYDWYERHTQRQQHAIGISKNDSEPEPLHYLTTIALSDSSATSATASTKSDGFPLRPRRFDSGRRLVKRLNPFHKKNSETHEQVLLKSKNYVTALATEIPNNGLPASDEPVEVVATPRNTRWNSFKKRNPFKAMREKLKKRLYLNIDVKNETKVKDTETSETILAPGLITISPKIDEGSAQEDVPKSEKKNFSRLWKLQNERNEPSSRHLDAPRSTFDSFPILRSSSKKMFGLFSKRSKKDEQVYEEMISLCSSSSSLHSIPAVISEDGVSVDSTVTCGYPIHSRDGNVQWVDVGLNMDYIKEQHRSASSSPYDMTYTNDQKRLSSSPCPRIKRRNVVSSEPVYTREALLQQRLKTEGKMKMARIPSLRRNTDLKRNTVHANCCVVKYPVGKPRPTHVEQEESLSEILLRLQKQFSDSQAETRRVREEAKTKRGEKKCSNV